MHSDKKVDASMTTSKAQRGGKDFRRVTVFAILNMKSSVRFYKDEEDRRLFFEGNAKRWLNSPDAWV